MVAQGSSNCSLTLPAEAYPSCAFPEPLFFGFLRPGLRGDFVCFDGFIGLGAGLFDFLLLAPFVSWPNSTFKYCSTVVFGVA